MAEWTTEYINSLPDSAFACIDAGGEKDDEGKTVPRSLRHYPHHNAEGELDMPHLRAALSRVAQEDTTSCGAGHLSDHAEEMGMDKGSSIPARKAFTPHDLKLTEAGEIELAFAQLNVIDADGDVTLPGAFPAKDVPMSAYGHTSWDGALPTGRGTISEVGDWAVLKGRFFMDTTAGRETHATLKGLGSLAEFSYGYNPAEFSYGQQDGKQVRFLKRLDVFEVSPVLRGAGIGTHILAIKSGAPEPDAPFAEQLSWYSEGLPALLDRFKGHAAARLSEGRKLSRADRAALEDLVETLDGQLAAARGLLTGPPPKALDVTVEVLLAEARRIGVPIPA